MDTFDLILSEARESFMPLAGVVDVGEGERGGRRCIVVFVVTRTPELEKIPSTIEGVPVVVHEVDESGATFEPGSP